MSEHGAAAESFSLSGKVEMAFFPGSSDAYHVRIDGERIETVVARMFGFPSEEEFDAALAAGLSPDPNVPSVVREMGEISLNVHQHSEGGMF